VKQLIVRELRALKTSAIVGTVGLLALMVLEALLTHKTSSQPTIANGPWYYALPLVSFMIGCRLIARERTQREIEFSHSWPVTRRQVWVAKVLAGMGVVCAIYVVVIGVGLIVAGSWLVNYMLSPDIALVSAVVLDQIAPTILLFGIGLLMSTFCPSPFNAMGTSFLALLLVGVGVWFTYTGFVAERWGPVIGFWPPDIGASAGGLVALAIMLGIGGVVASYFGFTRTLPLQFTRRTRVTLGLGVTLTVMAGALLPLGLWAFGEPEVEDIASIEWGQTSPDGRWIAFDDRTPQAQYDKDGSHYTSGTQRYRSWLIRADGGGLRCIGRWPMGFTGIWSHQRWLPLHWRGSERELTRDSVWMWDAERMQMRRLPRPPRSGMDDSSPAARTSPGGRYVLVHPHIISLGDEFVLADARLPDDAEFAGWAPDDSHIYFVSSRKQDGDFGPKTLWSMSLPGGGLELLQVSPDTTASYCSVSPDGRWVAWSRSHPVDERHLVVQSYPGGETTARFEGAAVPRPPWGWSPDGRFLWTRAGGQWTVISLDEELSARQVGPDWSETMTARDLHWSVAGNRCVFACMRGQDEERHRAAFVANADGSDMRKIADVSPSALYWSWLLVGWSDDDRVIVREEYRRFVAIDPDTLQREVIFEAPNAGYTRDEQ